MINKLLTLLLLVLTMGLAANAQTYTREGNTFISSTGSELKLSLLRLNLLGKIVKVKYPVYISSNGSCFVIKVSAKTGKEYRNYLGSEISKQICKELNVEYKSKKGK